MTTWKISHAGAALLPVALLLPDTALAEACPTTGCTIVTCDDASDLAPHAEPFAAGPWGGFAEGFESGIPSDWTLTEEPTDCSWPGGGFGTVTSTTIAHQSGGALSLTAHPATVAGTVTARLRREFPEPVCDYGDPATCGLRWRFDAHVLIPNDVTMFGDGGPELSLDRGKGKNGQIASLRYVNPPGVPGVWQVRTNAGWQVVSDDDATRLVPGQWYRVSLVVDFSTGTYTRMHVAGYGQDTAVDLGTIAMATEKRHGPPVLGASVATENACGTGQPHPVLYDDLRVRPAQSLAHEMKNWLLAHAPCKHYRPRDGSYLGVRGTPGAACEAIRALATYHDQAPGTSYVGPDPRPTVLDKIGVLAGWIVSHQHDVPTDLHFGGFPSAPDYEGYDNFYYAIDAGFCGEALLDAYDLIGDPAYLDAAVKAALFLRRMQNPLDPSDPGYDWYVASTHTLDENGTPTFFGGAMEYFLANPDGSGAYNNTMHSKLMLAVPFLSRLGDYDGTHPYATWGSELRDFLLYGLSEGYEYFQPNSPWTNDYGWYRVPTTEGDIVYEDSMAYGIRALFGDALRTGDTSLLPTVRAAYEKYNACTHGNPLYDPDIAWTGYLLPGPTSCSTASDEGSGKLYYDLSGAGILGLFRAYEYPAADVKSFQALTGHPHESMYWAVGFDWSQTYPATTGDANAWLGQDANAIANVMEYLAQTGGL